MASSTPKRTTVPGSLRAVPSAAKLVGKSDPDQRIEITIMVRAPKEAPTGGARADALLSAAALPASRQYLSRETFAAQRGADLGDIASIEAFAHDHNLTVNHSSVAERLVKVSGNLKDLTQAFGANVKQYRVGREVFRGRSGELTVPASVADKITGVFGFDTRPAAQPRFRALGAADGGKAPSLKKAKSGKSAVPKSKSGKSSSAAAKKKLLAGHGVDAANNLQPFTALEVAKIYNFPTNLDGSGQCIGLIELNSPNQNNQLGTGYTIADLNAYFTKLKLPMPKITPVGISGGANLPGIDPDSDVEVMLDIQVAGTIATGASIVVYFGLNNSKGFIDVLSAAVHDSVRKPSVISISWGGPEDPKFTSQQQLDGLEQILQDAAQLGITVCCSAGDDGSPDLPLTDEQGQHPRDGKPHVDFPASSAFALACGGTTLTASGSVIASEVVWNEGDPKGPTLPSGSTGGGVSNIFALPSYQSKVTVPKSPNGFTGRGVPDVAGNADSATGYLIKLAGHRNLEPVGGTSAVAPLWAGLLALVNQRLSALGKPAVGLLHPTLYANPTAFRDITVGNNDIGGTLHKYSAATGWDPCTGLGTPDGTAVMKALGG